MAEEKDDSQRTEDPTQKKLQDAREKGDFPRSQDLVTFATLSAGTFAIVVWGAEAGSIFVDRFTTFIAHAESFDVSSQGIGAIVWAAAGALALILAVPFVAMLIGAIAGNLVQAPLVLTGEKLKIKFSKLSPAKGAKRLFGGEALVNFAKGLLKVTCAGAAAVWAVWPETPAVLGLIDADPRATGAAALALVTRMLGAVLAVVAIFAAIDWFWQRYTFMKRMRMSKQDIRDEMKQSEGDPLVKMKIRQVRMERGRKRMMAAVPEATVIVTNPTHYAVALKYESGVTAAPKCVAKGVDALALRIRELAGEHEIPIVENPPLARALYAAVEVDAEIPVEHYKAVAQIIGFVMKKRRAN